LPIVYLPSAISSLFPLQLKPKTRRRRETHRRLKVFSFAKRRPGKPTY
jgi:hypothetical protein